MFVLLGKRFCRNISICRVSCTMRWWAFTLKWQTPWRPSNLTENMTTLFSRTGIWVSSRNPSFCSTLWSKEQKVQALCEVLCSLPLCGIWYTYCCDDKAKLCVSAIDIVQSYRWRFNMNKIFVEHHKKQKQNKYTWMWLWLQRVCYCKKSFFIVLSSKSKFVSLNLIENLTKAMWAEQHNIIQ